MFNVSLCWVITDAHFFLLNIIFFDVEMMVSDKNYILPKLANLKLVTSKLYILRDLAGSIDYKFHHDH